MASNKTPIAATRCSQEGGVARTNKNSLSFILCAPSSVKPMYQQEPAVSSLSPIAKRQCLQPKTRPCASSLFVQPTIRSSVNSPSTVKKSSKLCMVDGCTSRAKHARKCWRHGGSVKCKVPECTNRAKSKGVCWSHGGGTFCTHPHCGTIAVSHGFCWAHGGGKRCQIDGCSRPAYKRTENHCTTHYKLRLRAAAVPLNMPQVESCVHSA